MKSWLPDIFPGRRLALLATVAAFCLIGTQAVAQEVPTAPPAYDPLQGAPEGDGFGGNLIVGGVVVPDYDGSEDYSVSPMIAGKLSYDTYYIQLRGLDAKINVSPFEGFEFGPSIGFASGRDDVKNNRVDRMRNIDSTVEGGVFAKMSMEELLDPTDELAFEIEVMTDLGDVHNGTTISFGPSYSFSPSESVRLGVDLSATYASGNYTDTYFGVDAGDARRSGLSPFDADGGIKDVGVMFNATYQWNKNWGITGIAGYTQLVGDAADSPIVDDEGASGQAIVGAGLVFSF
nr:MipA/OmpV family protein [uncultured Dongia sp.]